MKLILPIAGVGQRLRPFTFSKPKGFVRIGGSRGVDHILTKIGHSLPNKPPLCLITGYKSVQIKNYLDNHYSEKFEIGYVEQEPLGYQADIPYFSGLGHAVLLTRNWFEKTTAKNFNNLAADDTLIFLSDMIPVRDYQFILEILQQSDNDGVLGTMIVPKEKTQFYGIVETDKNDFITDMKEKPKFTNSNQAISGVYALKGKTMKRLYEILQDQYNLHLQEIKMGTKQRMEFQFTPGLQQLVTEGFRIKSAVFKDGILDFGRPEALLNGNRVLLEADDAHVHGAVKKIENSVITAHCAIGNETEIIRSIIGPFVSVGRKCIIEDCNLEDVVIGDNCILKNIISKKSIIGDNVKMEAIIKDHITLGDNSTLVDL